MIDVSITYSQLEFSLTYTQFAASNRAPSWVKTVSLLTQLHDRQAIQLIPFVKNGGKGQHQISKSYRFEIETAELVSNVYKCTSLMYVHNDMYISVYMYKSACKIY